MIAGLLLLGDTQPRDAEITMIGITIKN